MSANAKFVSLLPQQVPGAIVVNVFVFLSTLALLSVVFRMIWLAVSRYLSKDKPSTRREYIFFGSQLGYYAASLLLANLFNSIAGLMGLPWLLQNGITQNSLCIAQATLMQFGNASNAYFTVAIGVHTFNSLVLRQKQSAVICFAFIAFGWLVSAAFAVAPQLAIHPAATGSLYGISGLSCGIQDDLPTLSFIFHLCPIFAASVISAVIYSLIFLVLRGTLSIRGGVKLTLDPKRRFSSVGEDYERFVAALARSMLWFPIAYVTLLIPYSVTRLLLSSQMAVPFQVIVMAYIFWFLLGAVDVAILYQTFRVLGPAFDHKIASSNKDMESFGAAQQLQGPVPTSFEKNVMQERIEQYRESGTTGYGQSSLRELVLPGHNRYGSNASHDSLRSYSSQSGLLRKNSGSSSIGRQIITSPEAALIASPVPSDESRDSLRSLPVPPRRVVISPRTGIPRSPASGGANLSPRQRSSSLPKDVPADELDVASWLDSHARGQSQRDSNQPSLSAVQSTFPSYATPVSAGPSFRPPYTPYAAGPLAVLPAPTSRQRR